MLGMKNHFDISDSIEIREVDIAGVACIAFTYCLHIKGQLFFWSFYFYCSVLVNPMIISTICIDLYCVLSKQDTCY